MGVAVFLIFSLTTFESVLVGPSAGAVPTFQRRLFGTSQTTLQQLPLSPRQRHRFKHSL